MPNRKGPAPHNKPFEVDGSFHGDNFTGKETRVMKMFIFVPCNDMVGEARFVAAGKLQGQNAGFVLIRAPDSWLLRAGGTEAVGKEKSGFQNHFFFFLIPYVQLNVAFSVPEGLFVESRGGKCQSKGWVGRNGLVHQIFYRSHMIDRVRSAVFFFKFHPDHGDIGTGFQRWIDEFFLHLYFPARWIVSEVVVFLHDVCQNKGNYHVPGRNVPIVSNIHVEFQIPLDFTVFRQVMDVVMVPANARKQKKKRPVAATRKVVQYMDRCFIIQESPLSYNST